MSHSVVSGVLASAVATSGTFSGAYPSGTGKADFVGGQRHKLVVQGAVFEAPRDFTIALNATATGWTVTYNGANTLRAGSTYYLELDKPGKDAEKDWASVAGGLAVPSYVKNSVVVHERLIDLGAPIASDDDALFLSATLGAGGALSLVAAGLVPDVPRNVIITNAGNDSGDTYVVLGTDVYGQTMSETITGANAGVAEGIKAFASVVSVTASGASAAAVKVGYGVRLGFPVFVPNAALVTALEDLGTPSNAPTITAGLSVLTKSTATTADVRGTYKPHASNLPNGTLTYQALVRLPDPGHIGNPQFAG